MHAFFQEGSRSSPGDAVGAVYFPSSQGGVFRIDRLCVFFSALDRHGGIQYPVNPFDAKGLSVFLIISRRLPLCKRMVTAAHHCAISSLRGDCLFVADFRTLQFSCIFCRFMLMHILAYRIIAFSYYLIISFLAMIHAFILFSAYFYYFILYVKLIYFTSFRCFPFIFSVGSIFFSGVFLISSSFVFLTRII